MKTFEVVYENFQMPRDYLNVATFSFVTFSSSAPNISLCWSTRACLYLQLQQKCLINRCIHTYIAKSCVDQVFMIGSNICGTVALG